MSVGLSGHNRTYWAQNLEPLLTTCSSERLQTIVRSLESSFASSSDQGECPSILSLFPPRRYSLSKVRETAKKRGNLTLLFGNGAVCCCCLSYLAPELGWLYSLAYRITTNILDLFRLCAKFLCCSCEHEANEMIDSRAELPNAKMSQQTAMNENHRCAHFSTNLIYPSLESYMVPPF